MLFLNFFALNAFERTFATHGNAHIQGRSKVFSQNKSLMYL